MDFSAAGGRSSLAEHHPEDSPQQLCPLQQSELTGAAGAPAASPCSPNHQGQDSWCVRHCSSAANSRLLSAGMECFGVFLLWKCSEVLKKQTQLLGMQWEVSGLGFLLSLSRVFAWENSKNSMPPMPSFPHYTIKMGKSPFLAACSSIDTNHPVLSQHSRAAIIILTADVAKSSDSVFTFWVCQSRSQGIVVFGSRLSMLCLCPWRSHFSCPRCPHRWNCTTNQSSSERQVMLKWKWWTHMW